MKSFLILALLLSLSRLPALAQAPGFATHGGGGNDDYGQRVALDVAGNSYVVGEFSGTATFDTASIAGPGRWNIYLAKYDRAGRVAWARTVAYTTAAGSDLYANAVAVDRSGHIYIAGRFVADVTFDGVSRVSVGSSDMYLVKLGPSGEFDWVKTPGGAGNGSFGQDGITSMGLDSAGNIYCSGHYNTDARFDAIQLSSTLTFEAFIAKYDSAGHVLWARSAGEFGALHIALGMAVDGAGNTYTTGKFFNKISFGEFVLDAIDAEQKIFIVKTGPDGTVLWAKKVGSGGYYGSAQGVAVDALGNVYVAGQFRATISFGTVEHSFGHMQYAILAVKYDRDGNYAWSVQATGEDQSAMASQVMTDRAGNVYLAGHFQGSMAFGPYKLSSAIGSGFVARLDANGPPAFAQAISGTGAAEANGLAITAEGDPVVVGSFSGTATIGTAQLSSAGLYDMFLARLAMNQASVDEPGLVAAGLDAAPNPASDVVRIRGAAPGDRVRVMSVTGALAIDAGEATAIDVSGLAPGVYFVRAGERTCRMIKTGSPRR
jgi:hypothetical protein